MFANIQAKNFSYYWFSKEEMLGILPEPGNEKDDGG